MHAATCTVSICEIIFTVRCYYGAPMCAQSSPAVSSPGGHHRSPTVCSNIALLRMPHETVRWCKTIRSPSRRLVVAAPSAGR